MAVGGTVGNGDGSAVAQGRRTAGERVASGQAAVVFATARALSPTIKDDSNNQAGPYAKESWQGACLLGLPQRFRSIGNRYALLPTLCALRSAPYALTIGRESL